MNISPDAPEYPPLKYYGGKWQLAEWLLSFFPSHAGYLEPCGGSAAVLLQKPRSEMETFNDLDGDVVNFFRQLRDNKEALLEKIYYTPYAREEFELCRTRSDDPLENARRFFFGTWLSISCMPFEKMTGWRSVSYAGQGYTDNPILLEKTIQALPQVVNRLRGVQIENRDALYCIERYDHETTLIYFDPPYIQSTRVAKKQYQLEVGDQFHIDVAELLKKAKSMVVVSGYACSLYADLYEAEGWARFDTTARTNGADRFESVWLSPKTVKALNRRLDEQVKLFSLE